MLEQPTEGPESDATVKLELANVTDMGLDRPGPPA